MKRNLPLCTCVVVCCMAVKHVALERVFTLCECARESYVTILVSVFFSEDGVEAGSKKRSKQASKGASTVGLVSVIIASKGASKQRFKHGACMW